MLPELFVALMVIGYVPPEPVAGVPLSVAVPFPLLVKVTPPGSVPVSLRVGVGDPEVITVKEPAVPTVKVVLLALVITAAVFTVSVKGCVALGSVPLLAVKVKV